MIRAMQAIKRSMVESGVGKKNCRAMAYAAAKVRSSMTVRRSSQAIVLVSNSFLNISIDICRLIDLVELPGRERGSVIQPARGLRQVRRPWK
jgi:hypothetical protein